EIQQVAGVVHHRDGDVPLVLGRLALAGDDHLLNIRRGQSRSVAHGSQASFGSRWADCRAAFVNEAPALTRRAVPPSIPVTDANGELRFIGSRRAQAGERLRGGRLTPSVPEERDDDANADPGRLGGRLERWR